MKYAFEVVKRASFRTLPSAVAIAYRIMRRKVMGPRLLVFGLASSDLEKVEAIEMPGYRVEHFLTWSDVSPYLREELSCKSRDLEWDVQKKFELGGTLWIGRLHGQLANAGWSRVGSKVRSWFFPLAPTWFVIMDCVTLPEFRWSGLYHTMLSSMAQTLFGQGADLLLTCSNDWNLPSIHGIEKAGFKKVGYGIKRKGRLRWYQIVNPDLTNI